MKWMEEVLERNIEVPNSDEGIRNQSDFAAALRDGVALCELINRLCPGAVKRINSNSNAPFKQVCKWDFKLIVIIILASRNRHDGRNNTIFYSIF